MLGVHGIIHGVLDYLLFFYRSNIRQQGNVNLVLWDRIFTIASYMAKVLERLKSGFVQMRRF